MKFRSRSRPIGKVSTDSGWNWTPSTGSSRCRTAITSPSSLVAETVRQSGTLGVCLGHQAVIEAFGGEIGPAARLLHGKTSRIHHDGEGIFSGIPQDFVAGRYHSLAATSVPDCLTVSATSDDGEVMAVRHRRLRVDGVQFHPESVLTQVGRDIARNFLGAAR